MGRRLTAALCGATCLVWLCAEAASAETDVSVSNIGFTHIVVAAENDNTVNDVQVNAPAGGFVTIDDTADDVTATTPCTQVDADTASCPVSRITVSLSGGSDDLNTNNAFTETMDIVGGIGNDDLDGGGGTDIFAATGTAGHDGGDTFSGDAGQDLVRYDGRTANLEISMGDGNADDGQFGENDNIQPSIETVRGGAGDDVFSGSGDKVGALGNDTFHEGASADGQSLIAGDAGQDTVSYSQRPTAISVTMDSTANDGAPGEMDLVYNGTEIVVGSASASNELVGNEDPNTFVGGSVVDELTGGAGDDSLTGNAGADTLFLGPGLDFVNTADGVADNIICTGGGPDSGTIDTTPSENFNGCDTDRDLKVDFLDLCPTTNGADANGCPVPVPAIPVTPAAAAPKKCKKGQKLKKGKCVRKKRKK